MDAGDGPTGRDALAGRWVEQIHPDDRARTIEDLRQTRATGASTLNEHRLLCKDGVYRWYLARSLPGRDRLGRIVSWYGTSTDIDALKQAQIAIAAQAEQASMAGKIALLGGWTLDMRTMRFNWSGEAAAVLGFVPGDAPELDSVIGLVTPPWHDLASRAVQDCLTVGTPFDILPELTTPDGRKRWVRGIGQAVRDGNGLITGMQGALQDVTESRRTATALLESEQRHAALFDAAPLPMWVMDQQTDRHVAVNDAALACYGYTREEFLARTPLDLRPAREQERMRELMAAGLAMNVPELWVHCRKDGTEFPVELVRRQIRFAERDAVFAVAFDITARVQAEQQAKAYLQTLQRAADAGQTIARHRTIAATMQEAAQQVRTILGAHQAVIGISRSPGAPPKIKAVSLSDMYARGQESMGDLDGSSLRAVVCETNRPLRMTQAALMADPRWRAFGNEAGAFPVNGWLTVPITAGDGANVGYLQLSDKYEGEFTEQDEYVASEMAQLASIAIQNVTLLDEVSNLNTGLEAKVAQRAAELASQEALFRALAEQAPQPIWTSDPKGRATFFSRAFYDLVGGTPPDWLGTGWVDLVHPDDVAEMTRNWLRCGKGANLYTGTRRLRAQDGTYHTTSYRAAPVRDGRGEVTFWVGIDADISELKATEAALRLANDELKTFSYSVSHDLRSPVAAVGGFNRALATELGGHASDKAQHYLARIQANVDRMEELIQGLLSLAQLSQADLRRETVDLSDMARELLQSLRTDGREGAFVVEAGLVVNADRRLMLSVMENLLGNAWKFSSRRALGEISVGWSRERNAYFVRDNGAGFDMAFAAHLFAPFQRLHSQADFAGTGVGLSTVSRVIARHGGRIWGESEPDKGATFYFTVPGPGPGRGSS